MTIAVLDVQRDGVSTATAGYRRLLARLDEHQLRDSCFQADRWLRSHPGGGWMRLVAHCGDEFVGFLAGLPATGHVSLLGAVTPCHAVGPALLTAFAQRARTAGARSLTLAVDSEPTRRWDRRRFFENHGFTAQAGSAVHFIKTPF